MQAWTVPSTTSAWTCSIWKKYGLQGRGSTATLKSLIVWVKDNGGMGTFHRWHHERIFTYKKGRVPNLNPFELGQHKRSRTNVPAIPVKAVF